jgi:hypothetical protein
MHKEQYFAEATGKKRNLSRPAAEYILSYCGSDPDRAASLLPFFAECKALGMQTLAPALGILESCSGDPDQALYKARELLDAARPYAPDRLREKLQLWAARYPAARVTPAQRGLAAMLLEKCLPGPSARRARQAVQLHLFGAASLADVPPGLVLAILNDWLKPAKTGQAYEPDPMAAREARAAYELALKAMGQMQLDLGG